MLKGLAIFTARSPGRRPVHVADLFSPLQQLGDQLGCFDLYRDDCRAKSHGKPRAADWGRMAIVDTKPFKLRVILHRIFVEKPQVTGIPAWPGLAALPVIEDLDMFCNISNCFLSTSIMTVMD